MSSVTAQRPADPHRGLAVSAGTVNPGITTDDVTTLVSAMRGLIHTVPGGTPDAWQRFLDIHLAGMTVPTAWSSLFLMPPGDRTVDRDVE